MLNSEALTKVQTVLVISIISFAAVGGAIAYYLSNPAQIPSIIQTPLPSPLFSSTPRPFSTPSAASTTTQISTPAASVTSGSSTSVLPITPTPFSTYTYPTTTFSASPTPTTLTTSITQPVPTAILQPKDPIRIGICVDLGSTNGDNVTQGTVLAVEQINAAGGLLGRNLTVVMEDDESATPPGDISVATNALIRLITVDKADYVVGYGNTNILTYQDVCSAQKEILFTVGSTLVDLTQRVYDNYDKYKYYFRTEPNYNSTALTFAHVQSLGALANATGFTKIGYLFNEGTSIRQTTQPYFESEVPKLGCQIVYRSLFPIGTADFTSYFAQAEAAGTQILFVIAGTTGNNAQIVNEWFVRQSPMLLIGDMPYVSDVGFWDLTHGNAESVMTRTNAIAFNYPLTNKTLAAKQAYQDRWGSPMSNYAAAAYDTVKFILSDAIRRAGTTETEAVIKSLEAVKVETSLSKSFQYTWYHDISISSEGVTNPSESSTLYITAQWQNGAQVPVFPESLRIEAGVKYKFPTWKGPWSK